jgi:hypothetical protein
MLRLGFADDLASASFMASEHGFQGRQVGESGLCLDKLQIRKTIVKLRTVEDVSGPSWYWASTGAHAGRAFVVDPVQALVHPASLTGDPGSIHIATS